VGIVADEERFPLGEIVVLHAETAGKKAFVYLESIALAFSHHCLGFGLGLCET
jgi:hypothetical protein